MLNARPMARHPWERQTSFVELNCRIPGSRIYQVQTRERLVRVKWLTHSSQKLNYERWEETAVGRRLLSSLDLQDTPAKERTRVENALCGAQVKSFEH